jgi:hypothetical protein
MAGQDTHYVPQLYLKGWTSRSTRQERSLWDYRIVVPSDSYKRPQPRAIRSAAMVYNLYSREYEQWFKEEIEDPAAPALAAVRAGLDPTDLQMEALVRFAMAQEVRTVKSFMGFREYAQAELPPLMEQMLEEIRIGASGIPTEADVEASPSFFRIEVEHVANDQVDLAVEVDIGLPLWLYEAQRVVRTWSDVVLRHNWQVLRAPTGLECPTSDHPMLRLLATSEQSIRMRAGWLIPGVELILPLSPEHLLFAQVGRPARDPRLTPRQMFFIRKVLCAEAHRSIFTREPCRQINWLLPRVTDPELFHREEKLRRPPDR